MSSHQMPRPSSMLGALSPIPSPHYERMLSALPKSELLAEYEAACYEFAGRESVAKDCERVRLARREVARRMGER